MMGNGYGWWGMGFGLLFMLLFWTFIILGIVAMMRWLRGQPPGAPPPPPAVARDKTPADIVRERYARGEIDKDEFEQKLSDLSK